jgi:copper oxidase (laccase) domain-containing protein
MDYSRLMELVCQVGTRLASSGAETYRVEESITRILAAYGQEAAEFIRPEGDKYYVNLKEINALSLRRAGVKHIEISTDCTVCQCHRFWSHRATKGLRGSQGAVIVCKEGRK